MPKIPECERCIFCAHDPHIVCAVHPMGVNGDICIDFREDPELAGKRFVDFLGINGIHDNPSDQEQWEPQGARYINNELVIERSYYNGEEIRQPAQRWSQEQQLWLLDNHPLFTGKCPSCGAEFDRDYTSRVHWDCPCGWMDDSI